jgi:hypothetical protein
MRRLELNAKLEEQTRADDVAASVSLTDDITDPFNAGLNWIGTASKIKISGGDLDLTFA